MTCFLCHPKENNIEIILENQRCYFIENTGSLRPGQGLLVPKEHIDNFFDFNAADLASLFALLKDVKIFLDDKYSPDGYNIGWDVGRVAGQYLSHTHIHVIPRYADEKDLGQGIHSWTIQHIENGMKEHDESELIYNLKNYLDS